MAEFDGLVDVGPVEFVGLLLRGVVTASVTVASTTAASTTAASTSVSIISTTVTIGCSAAVVTKLVDEDAVERVDDWRRKVEWRGKWWSGGGRWVGAVVWADEDVTVDLAEVLLVRVRIRDVG